MVPVPPAPSSCQVIAVRYSTSWATTLCKDSHCTGTETGIQEILLVRRPSVAHDTACNFLSVGQRTGAAYACLVPLIDNNTFRATLRPPAYGTANTFIRVESGDESVLAPRWDSVLLIAAGT